MTAKNNTMTLALETLGCKLNQAESEHLALELARAGYRLVPPVDGADIYVLNTCTVTHIADRKCRHLLRLARRRNPDALIIAVGCYADRAPEELMGVSGVDMVIGNGGKADLVHTMKQRAPATAAAESPPSRTRSSRGQGQGGHGVQGGCTHRHPDRGLRGGH